MAFKRALCVTATIGLAGCATLRQTSIHDPELATAALQAQSAFASAGSGDLWTTMLDNLERSATVERELLGSTMSMRFEGQLQGVEDTTWDDIIGCAQGQCGDDLTADAVELTGESVLATTFDSLSTSDKIGATTAEMADIGKEIETLSMLMVSDPSGANETGMLSPAPTSFLADAIGLAERKVATLEEKLDAAKQKRIGQLEAAITAYLPRLPSRLGARREAIRAALEGGIDDIRRALDAASIDALAATAAAETNRLLTAAGATPDDGLDLVFASMIRNAFGSFPSLDAHLEATDGLLTEAETLVAAALGEGTPPSERLAVIADVLRKAEHLDFLKPDTLAEVLEGAALRPLSGDVAEALGVDTVQELLELIEQRDARIEALADRVSIARLFEELRSEPLSEELAAALQVQTGRGIGDVGALLDYLKTDESRLQEVRVALMADWRRAVVEGRALKLESLRYRLGLTEKLGRALTAQQFAEQGIAAQIEIVRACLPALDPEATAFATLDSLARGTALSFNAANADCGDELGTARNQFQNLVGLVGAYFTRVGYLHDNQRLAEYELVRYEHRRSIDASRIAAAAHEQLVKHGLQGLVAFTQGGLTAEQVATVLRFLNVGLLNVIANQGE